MRVVVLCIAVALSMLAINSTIDLAGLFDGPLFVLLLIADVVCWTAYSFAARTDRLRQCERRERVRNFIATVHYVDGDARIESVLD